jgi:hypothetical protein
VEAVIGLATLLAISGGLFAGYLRGRGEPGLRRALMRVPPHPIAGFPDGQGGVILGKARDPAEALVAPVSGRSCLAYVVTVAEFNGLGWDEVLRESRFTDFTLSDASGDARVDTSTVVVAAQAPDLVARINPARPTEALEAFLRARHQSCYSAGKLKYMRIAETAVLAGPAMCVAGIGSVEYDPAGAAGGTYRELPRRLVLRGDRKRRLVMCADPAFLRSYRSRWEERLAASAPAPADDDDDRALTAGSPRAALVPHD